MYSENYNRILETMKNAFSPLNEFNKACTNGICKMIKMHSDTVSVYSDIAIDQINASTHVKDISSMMKFNENTVGNIAELCKINSKNTSEASEIVGSLKANLDEMTAPSQKSTKK